MKKITITLFFLIGSLVTMAQQHGNNDEAKAEMQKLRFLEGQWEGSGWIMGQDRNKMSFTQQENIQFKLDDTALLIEGKGKNNGIVMHDALAIIIFDNESKAYKFNSFLSDGRNGSYKAEIIGDKLYWYPADYIRYIIEINKDNQWYEIGEINKEGNWYQFFEMTLNKK